MYRKHSKSFKRKHRKISSGIWTCKVSQKGHFQTFKNKMNKLHHIKINNFTFLRHNLESRKANHSVGKNILQ